MKDVRIDMAESDSQIMDCFAVLCELRPHLDSDSFLGQFRELQRTDRYQLGFVTLLSNEKPQVVAVAGFCIQNNLSFGRHLLLQDFVTASPHRSQGYGGVLLEWGQVVCIATRV